MSTGDFLNNQLSQKTAVFGLKLWEVIGIGVGAFIVLILFFLSLWLSARKKSKEKRTSGILIPKFSKEIKVDRSRKPIPQRLSDNSSRSPSNISEDRTMEKEVVHIVHGATPTDNKFEAPKLHPETGRDSRQTPSRLRGEETRLELSKRVYLPAVEKGVVEGERRGNHSLDRGSGASGESRFAESPAPSPTAGMSVPEVSHLGWGHWYTLRELEAATDSFSDSTVLGEGGYGIVYLGRLPDGTPIAVKNLLNNRGQAEREFKVEVEAIGRVRHKNLVRLLGYCMEGSHRMLVYEYIDNGNLEQWLHGPLGEAKPLTWEIRMKIILGTAKGLAYLHEGLEPKVVHRDVKSSNILLDSQWNAKVSDFGLAKLLGAGNSHVTTRVMGTFGYVAPEYASTGMLNEKSDVYSYGVLVMELITGRDPVDYSKPAGEVNLVDWLKMMVGCRRSDEVADPTMEPKPSPRALKRALLVALRCVDPDAQKRPKMGHVVHMLEADDNPFREERKNARDSLRPKSNPHHLQTSLQNQGISLDSPSYTAAQRETPGRRATNKDAPDGEPISTVDPRARWRYEG